MRPFLLSGEDFFEADWHQAADALILGVCCADKQNFGEACVGESPALGAAAAGVLRVRVPCPRCCCCWGPKGDLRAFQDVRVSPSLKESAVRPPQKANARSN